MKLVLAADPTVSERLKADAEEISSVLQRRLGSSTVSMPLQVGKVLGKMEEWDKVAATIPAVVSRLRSLKVLHDEARGVRDNVRDLNMRFEKLHATAIENEDLARVIRGNFEGNLKVINENLFLLGSKVEALETRLTKPV